MSEHTFALAAALEVVGGLKLTDDGMTGVGELMSHIVGRPVYTHEIPQLLPGCAAWILAGHPYLGEAVEFVRSIPASDLPRWLAHQQQKFGTAIQINPVPAALLALGQDAK